MRRASLWIILVGGIPLAVNPFSRWHFEPDKAALLLLLAGLLAGGGLRLPRRAVALPLALYTALAALATLNSAAPAVSLWGAPGWRAGLLAWLACALLFLAANAQLRDEAARRRALDALLIGSAPVCALGLAQAAGLDPLAALTGGGPRVTATFGHPNFFAAYLAMVAPLTLGRAVAARTGAARRGWGALLAAQIACMVLTLSRSGWLAMAASLGMAALVTAWRAGRRRLAGGMLVGAAGSGALLLGLSALPALSGDAPPLLQTLTSVFRAGSPTVQVRLLGWEAAARMIADRPALGFGPGTFGLALNAYYPPRLALFGGVRALGGHPHNLPLDLAASVGAPGAAAYAWLIAAVLWGMARRAARGDIRETATLAAALGGLAASALEFDTITAMTLFWLLAGLSEAAGAAPTRALHPPKPARVALGAAGVVCALALALPDLAAGLAAHAPPAPAAAIIAWASRAAPTPGDYADVMGGYFARAGQWGAGAAAYREMIAAAPPIAQARLWRALGDFHARRAGSAPDRREAGLSGAAEAYTRALAFAPADPDLWLDRGMAYLDLGKPEAARADFAAAAALVPDYERVARAQGEYYLAVGDQAAARAAFARAETLRAAWGLYLWQR